MREKKWTTSRLFGLPNIVACPAAVPAARSNHGVEE